MVLIAACGLTSELGIDLQFNPKRNAASEDFRLFEISIDNSLMAIKHHHEAEDI